jgi:hypothetical protein
MNTNLADTKQYAKCLLNSKKANWDIDQDVIRFRTLDANDKYLPDGLSLANQLSFLDADERRFMSQVQGRSYCYIFALVERFINAKVVELSLDHVLGDQTALEAMLQFSSEEIKHQELFRRIEMLAEATLPPGYQTAADPNDVANAVLSKSTWGVLGLTCHIEIFTQVHYLESLKSDETLSPLFKDVFKYHWMEESQHATLDELEWARIHKSLTHKEIEEGVDDLIDLVVAVDGILQAQAASDSNYFISNCERSFSDEQIASIQDLILRAYRWQYIVSGVQVDRFQKALTEKLNDQQVARITTALEPLINHVEAQGFNNQTQVAA